MPPDRSNAGEARDKPRAIPTIPGHALYRAIERALLDLGYAAGTGGGLADGDYGDVTVSGSGTAIAIDAGAVTNAKMADMSQASVKGRPDGAGTGAPTDLTQDQLIALVYGELGDPGWTGVLAGQTLDTLQELADAVDAHTHEGDTVALNPDVWTGSGGALDGSGITTVQDLADWLNANLTP